MVCSNAGSLCGNYPLECPNGIRPPGHCCDLCGMIHSTNLSGSMMNGFFDFFRIDDQDDGGSIHLQSDVAGSICDIHDPESCVSSIIRIFRILWWDSDVFLPDGGRCPSPDPSG